MRKRKLIIVLLDVGSDMPLFLKGLAEGWRENERAN